MPNALLSELTTAKKRTNYAHYLNQIKDDIAAGKAGALAVFDIDRAVGCVRRTQIVYDKIMSLKCKGPNMFVISTDDIDAAIPEKKVHRFITLRDRFTLQGQDGSYADLCQTQRQAMKLTGNACATLQTAAVLLPMIEKAMLVGALSAQGLQRVPKRQLLDMIPTCAPKRSRFA